MSTVVTHQHGQARSVKIWVDENARRWPAQALRGFNAALVPISPTVWNMTLAGDVLGGGLFQSVALLPNGLSIEITHSQVESFSFTQLPVDPLTWSYVVARCPWVAAMPLVPTYEIVSAAAFDIETDCIIGLLRREGGHTPIFYSQVAGGHNWPIEMVKGTLGLKQFIDFDFSHYGTGNGDFLAVTNTTLRASRVVPAGIRRNRQTSAPLVEDYFKLVVDAQPSLTPIAAPLDIVRVQYTLTLRRVGVAFTIVDSGVVSVSLAGPGTGLLNIFDEQIDLDTLLGSSTAEFQDGDIVELVLRRLGLDAADTYLADIRVTAVRLEYVKIAPGTDF